MCQSKTRKSPKREYKLNINFSFFMQHCKVLKSILRSEPQRFWFELQQLFILVHWKKQPIFISSRTIPVPIVRSAWHFFSIAFLLAQFNCKLQSLLKKIKRRKRKNKKTNRSFFYSGWTTTIWGSVNEYGN